MKKLYLALIFSIFLLSAVCFAAPKVMKVELSANVGANFYAAVLDEDQHGIWINPGDTIGDYKTNPTDTAADIFGGTGATAKQVNMHGVATGYGQLILSFNGVDTNTLEGELTALTSDSPANKNTEMFGGETGPVNKKNIDLNRGGIPSGTGCTVTIQMNGEVPHIVAVMGGVHPEVSYDAAGGTLTIYTKTFGCTTFNNDTFTSIIGFSIFTADTATFGTESMRIAVQSNHWVGDMFPILPGHDANAAKAGIGGAKGSFTARCGMTVYGPSGESRDINVFFPDASFDTIFPSTSDTTNLRPFEGTQRREDVIPTRVTKFGVPGILASFTYNFSSPEDLTLQADALSSVDTSTTPNDTTYTIPSDSLPSKGGDVTYLQLTYNDLTSETNITASLSNAADSAGSGANYAFTLPLQDAGQDTITLYFWTNQTSAAFLFSLGGDSTALDTGNLPSGITTTDTALRAFDRAIIDLKLGDSAGAILEGDVSAKFTYTIVYELSQATAKLYYDLGFDTAAGSTAFALYSADSYTASWASDSNATVSVEAGAGGNVIIRITGITQTSSKGLGKAAASSSGIGGGGGCLIESLTNNMRVLNRFRGIRDIIMNTPSGRKLVDFYYRK